jgi:hypothetical protein
MFDPRPDISIPIFIVLDYDVGVYKTENPVKASDSKLKVNGEVAEKLFAELCGKTFLEGFVFHSPRFVKSGVENEIGDVVIWVRDLLVVFEVVWREPIIVANTKQFVKRIGEKRDQLVRDFEQFAKADNTIYMVPLEGNPVIFQHDCFSDSGFCGIVIVDSTIPLEKLHIETFRKLLKSDFPIAIMTAEGFSDLIKEVDTPSDLFYYLKDRNEFLKQIFESNVETFLDLNQPIERSLIGFYKQNKNTFSVEHWKASEDYWSIYQQQFFTLIERRNKENRLSIVIDELIQELRKQHESEQATLLHAWELAILPRRSRALLAPKISVSFENMKNGNRADKHFAFLNEATRCWSVFFFYFGNDSGYFEEKGKLLAKSKVQFERFTKNFEYSVFLYAFRKSSISTNNSFDEAFLWIEDAADHPEVAEEEFVAASKYFAGISEIKKINEFPP